MKLPRVAGVAAGVMMIALWAGCGDTFRPVAIPIGSPAPDPQPLLLALVLHQQVVMPPSACADSTMPPCDGMSSEINVSGDSNVANVVLGQTPVHALLTLDGRAVAANRDGDSLSVFALSSPGATPTTINLRTGAKPVFLASAAGLVYVADSGLNSVSVVTLSSNSVVTTVPVGANPVVLAATPDGKKVFVANRDDNTVSVISTTDNTVESTIGPNPGDVTPVYVLANPAGTAMYVLYAGSGSVSPSIAIIDPFSDGVTGHLSLPAGGNSNFMAFDSHLQRLYVTNPGKNSVSIFDVTPVPPNAPNVLATVAVGAQPVALAPLSDGSRVYVVNTGATTGCAGEANMGQVTVINATSNSVPASGGCISVGPSPVWIAASSSSKIYVPHQAAGSQLNSDGSPVIPVGTTIINASTNRVEANLPAPAGMTPAFVLSE
jgi:YVTN family beta-propeller protein